MTGDTGRGHPSSHDEEEDETTTTVAALPRDVLVVRLFFFRSKSESSHFFLLFLQHKRRINRASLACDSLSLALLRKKKKFDLCAHSKKRAFDNETLAFACAL